MCGLVSVLSKKHYGFTKKQIDIFSSLLFVDLLRGDDSTGVFVATNKGEVALAKDAVDSLSFLKTSEYGKICNRALKEGAALIGHNRKATTGVIKDTNAHPFVVDDKVVLVHNGTLYGDHKKHADVEVDSHAIAHVIHENESLEKALQSLNGAYALIWYDVENQKVNFIRNNMRPLWWMETDDEWIWASEKNFLMWVQHRFDLRLKGKDPAYSELPPNTLNTFTYNPKDNDGWDIESVKVNTTSYTPVHQQPHHGRHPYDSEFDDYDPRASAHAPYSANDANPLAEWESQMIKEHGRTITYSEFYRIKDIFAEDKKVEAFAFDYNYVNKANPDVGWYLYLASSDYPNVVFKRWYAANDVQEETLIDWATNNRTGIVEVGGAIRWDILKNGSVVNGVHVGKCMCRASEFLVDAKIIDGEEVTVNK